MLDSKEIYEELKRIRYFDGVYYRVLKVENGITWAVVFGWHYEDHRNRLEGKFAYNDTDMQCDYEWDWLLPLVNTIGDVLDTRIKIESEEDVKWLIDQAEKFDTSLYNL